MILFIVLTFFAIVLALTVMIISFMLFLTTKKKTYTSSYTHQTYNPYYRRQS